jgi:hypothetical protein
VTRTHTLDLVYDAMGRKGATEVLVLDTAALESSE